MNYWKWCWFLIAAIISTIGTITIKYYLVTKKSILFILALLLSLFSVYAYYKAFTYGKMGIAYPIIKSLSIVLVVLASICLFHEYLNCWNILGIIAIIVGIILISI